jgi:single-strand DNA-binding protein
MPMATPTVAARSGPGAPGPDDEHDPAGPAGERAPADRNEVRLVGRISGAPERRTLPSGDEVVRLRLVVRREDDVRDTVPIQVGPAPGPGGRASAGQTGRRQLARVERLAAGTRVDVRGQLRRRWWEAGGARRSRLEVVASEVQALDR